MNPLSSDDSGFDFAKLLEQSLEQDAFEVRRGDLLTGTILAVDDYGIIVDCGLKRDGVVPRSDLEDLGLSPQDFAVGSELRVMVVRMEDRDGNLQVSIKQARATVDWDNAESLLDNGETYCGQIIAANKGGLIVPFGELRGFVPASHVIGVPRGLDDDERREYLQRFVGKSLELKVIEVNARRRRLVLSQRAARREAREEAKERLLEALTVGDIVDGTVSSLRDFGAFVDIGGADGLIHVSELAWHRINHPSEIVKPGDRIKAQIIQLDDEDMRIGLSLKRLLPNPWEEIAAQYEIGMQVQGVVSRIVSFGAFVELENSIEALLHISELSDPPPDRVEDVVAVGDPLSAEIVSLEPDRQRMGLSLRNVSAGEEDEYLSEEALA